MRRKSIFILIGVAAVVAALIVPRLFSVWKAESARPPAPAAGSAPAPPPALRVFVHRAEPRVLAEKINANGTLLANESIELRSEISGRVVALHIEEGTRVSRGDLLLKINDSDLAAQLRQTIHRIELAKAQAARQRLLIERGGTSQESLDVAISEVHVLEAEADVIRAELEKTEIRAPFDGVVGLRFVSEGSYLTPATRIATLQDIDRLKIDFSISERHMDRVRTGSAISFSVAGRPERFTGEIYALEPSVDVATRTVILRARTENPGGRLMPGAYASVEVTLEEIRDAILVPTVAIVPGLNQRTLFVINNGRAEVRTVETGIRLDREIQITGGVSPGEEVITSGLLQLRSGMPVQAMED